MVAASKLYPEATMVFEGKPTRQVREFLALHKDALPISDLKSIDLSTVSKVVIVDTRSAERLGSLAKLIAEPQVELHIYDHHPKREGDLVGAWEQAEIIGATTTLMVEKLRAEGCLLSKFEATLLALGIYEDTGNLLFESTTARDAAALSFLLACGANLKLVSEFRDRPLSREQKSLLNMLLTAARHYLIRGVRVLICATSLDEFVAGLALLTHKVGEIENIDLIFAVVKMDDRVHIVARGKGKNVAVNDILSEFGGAGHPKAASATVKGGDVTDLINRILCLLEERIVPDVRAREIMSIAVKSIDSLSRIRDAGDLLLRYGHTGLPVVDEGKLVGIISRRDVDKALNHGLGHAPVSGYMSRKVITVDMDAPLNEIESLMIEHDIGRLPVVSGGILVGILSRSDVLRTLHGQAIPVSRQIMLQRSEAQGHDVLRLLEEQPQDVRDLFRLIHALGEAHGLAVYVVGGFVRDLLLEIPNLDIDLVVEGDGLKFAAALATELQVKAQFHPQFATANMRSSSGLQLDIVTARTEHYPSPAALPLVETSSLKQDLYRRDFTINAMAIALTGEKYASLHDYYGGYRDLQQGVIRILHNLSFVDDPKRIVRAIRFECRLRFRLEAQTSQMLQQAVGDRLLDCLSRDRLRDELSLVLQEKQVGKVIRRLVELGLWQQIMPHKSDFEPISLSNNAQDAVGRMQELGLWGHAKAWHVQLAVLFRTVSPPDTATTLQKLNFDRRSMRVVQEFQHSYQVLKGFLSNQGELSMVNVHRTLAKLPTEVVCALLAMPELQAHVIAYLQARSTVRVMVTGDDLQALGVPAGPLYAKILDALWEARLAGGVKDKAEEMALVQKILEEVPDGS